MMGMVKIVDMSASIKTVTVRGRKWAMILMEKL